MDPDGGPASIECSTALQDCPRGEKCNVWANDGGTAWNATRCFPVVPNPDGVGEPCTVEGSGVSGLDSCSVGSMCWDIDIVLGEGTCVAYCTESVDRVDPAFRCVAGARTLSICLPQCDPLVGDCPEGLVCVPSFSKTFACGIPEDELVDPFETCTTDRACPERHACVDAADVSFCDDPGRCCAPFCDLEAPACPAGTACVPFVPPEDATVFNEDIGVCR